MTQTEATRFAAGLPKRFVGEQGFVRLCDLLGISRPARQQLAAQFKRASPNLRPPKGLQTKERHRFYITTFYSQPDFRRDHWERTLPVVDKPNDLFPSMEHRALVVYDPEYLTREVREQELAEILPNLSDANQSLADLPDAWRPALAVWPSLRQDVLNWAECSPERQSCVVAAVFAVATVLEDVALLRWAGEQVPDLADEFAFALDSRQGNAGAEEDDDSPCDDSDVIQRWNRGCREAVALLSKMGADSPQPQLLPDLHRALRVLDELHDSLLAVQDAKRLEKLVQQIADTIAALAEEHDARWLRNAIGQIHARWKLRYLISGGSAADQLRREIKRVESVLPNALSAWSRTRYEIVRLEAELSRLPEQPGDNLKSFLSTENQRGELEKSIARHRDQGNTSMLDVLDRVAPEGCKFDPSKDYETEWGQRDTVRNDSSAEHAQPNSQIHSAAGTQKNEHVLQDSVPSDGVTPDYATATASEPFEASRDSDTTENASVGDAKTADPGEPLEGANEGVRHPVTTVKARLPAESQDAPILPSTDAIDALWSSINHRPGIAYHIARLLSEQNCSHSALPPPDLVAATILSDHVRSADDKIAHALKKQLRQVDPERMSGSDPHLQDSLHLLLFSATIRPALIVPATGAPSLLRRINLSDSLAPVCDFAVAVAQHAERLQHVRLDISLFAEFDWTEQLESIRARTRDWLGNAKRQRILYGPAHRVWLKWLEEAGCLGKLAALLLNGGAGGKREIKDLIELLSTRKSFDSLVEETYRRIRPGKRGSIEGRARPQLEHHAGPLIHLAKEWLRLIDAAPESRANFVDRSLKSLRRKVEQLGGRARQAIEEVVGFSVSGPLHAALTRAGATVDALHRLFEQPDSVGVSSDNLDALLINDLLYVTGIDVDMDTHRLVAPVGADTLALLADVDAHAQTLGAACQARLDRGDLHGARLAYHLMEKAGGAKGPETESGLDQCRASLDRAERKRRIELLEIHTELQEELEQVFCFKQLSDEEEVSLRTDLAWVEDQLQNKQQTHAIVTAGARLKRIRQSLAAHTQKGKAEARTKFKSLADGCEPDGRLRVEHAIDQGDLLTADELMSRIEAGEQLDPDASERRELFREFMAVVDGIERRLFDANGIEVFVKAAEERKTVDGVRFEEISESEIEAAVQLIGAWEELSRRKVYLKDTVDALLTSLGLPLRSIPTEPENQGRNWAEAIVETDFVQDRSRCPLPQFGSAARGRYRVLLDWGKTARESIPQIMSGSQDAATIVLHFEPLGADRNWLRRWAIDEQRVFLVIDPALMVFLAPRGSERLSALFRCALPLTAVEPYVTTPGYVPPELFFGRALERKRITNSTGTCFIYGGRQLGKTALLRTVEREFHQPDKQQIAKWIDLKTREIGHERKAAEIWPLLWRELCQLKVVKRVQLPEEPNPDNADHIRKLIDMISQWVTERGNRRLLLLLDEADNFLDADARTDFRESTRLKGLMDRTDRRFKVVFAGLHNVLRTTQRANHPLAHFGVPIKVGPLLDNGEWLQAQQLIREPLQSVGYGFADRNLSTRILWQTNYYPSLIQLYGEELVRRLRDSKKPVPYDIQATDITDVYRGNELESAIRERFLWTLHLDERYFVIAHALAFELRGNPQQHRRSLDRGKIREYASGWWPEGFGDDSREFNVLLQEMEGLGVLRSTEGGKCYTFRNTYILSLLGSEEEIARVLDRPREVPTKFEPSVFHARQSDADNGARRRCPLTYEQESMLRARGGVTVIAGCDAAEIGSVKDFLPQRIEKQSFHRLSVSKDVVEFRQNLMKLQPGSADAINVVLVPPDASWDSEWLEVATSALKRKKLGHLLRVVFVTDPDRLWQVMIGLETTPIEPDWISIAPWDEIFVRQWLEDDTLPCDRDQRKALMALSGGWSMVLDRFVRRSRNSLAWDKRIDRLQRELAGKREWLLRLGITPAVGTELGMLLRHQPFGPSDIKSVSDLEGADPTVLERRAIWGERLGLLTRAEDQWRFNSLVERLLGGGSA